MQLHPCPCASCVLVRQAYARQVCRLCRCVLPQPCDPGIRHGWESQLEEIPVNLIVCDHGLCLCQRFGPCDRDTCFPQRDHQRLEVRVVILEIVIGTRLDTDVERFRMTDNGQGMDFTSARLACFWADDSCINCPVNKITARVAAAIPYRL